MSYQPQVPTYREPAKPASPLCSRCNAHGVHRRNARRLVFAVLTGLPLVAGITFGTSYAVNALRLTGDEAGWCAFAALATAVMVCVCIALVISELREES